MADRIGQQLGNYRLTYLLGQGGFAEVYLGEHIYLKIQAAVKVLYTQLAREDFEDFQAEARTVANLEHPNIVRVLEFGIEGAVPFLVMSYAPNGSLRQRHPRGTPLPLPLILQYVRQMADALQYAHDEKLIHRDIKPENMLLGRRNEVLLSDFGIAIISQTSRSKSVQEVIGTVAYMSPEMLQGKPKAVSDQYALGIVVYEWLCGQRPFHGGFTELASQHMFVPPPSLREKNPTISPDLEQVVMTALAKEPQQRFSSVHAFAHALEQAGQSAAYQPTVYAPPAQPFQPTQPATPSHSPPQPTVPPAESQFPQPLAGTTTPSQPISSPMLNTPSSSSALPFSLTKLSSKASSQSGLLTPPFSQPLPPTVAAASSNSSSQPATLEETSNPSLPPTRLAVPADQPLQPTVPASPPSEKPFEPNIVSNLAGEMKSPRQGISRRTFMLGLAGLAGVAAVGGSIALLLNRSKWDVQQSGTSDPLCAVAWSGSQFVAVGDNGTILTSPDGSSWSAQNAGTSELLQGMVWSGSQFVVVGGRGIILTSPNGSSWSAQNAGTSQYLIDIAWSGSQFAVVGDNGTILTSPDGSSWSAQNAGTSERLQGIAWSGSQFVVVGGRGIILTSPNGSSWSAQNAGTSELLCEVVWSGSQFVVVGFSGTILTSPDGSSWSAQNAGTSDSLYAVAWSGSQFVVVGNTGIIFTSS